MGGYSTHRRATFRLVPLEHQLAGWREDYKAMLGPMFFGEEPTFDQILAEVSQLEKEFNRE